MKDLYFFRSSNNTKGDPEVFVTVIPKMESDDSANPNISFVRGWVRDKMKSVVDGDNENIGIKIFFYP